ncbi:maleylacetoacetate isomerase [Corallincola luteus]|uniref:Maleylacetoacetate isomerase n=1 Tax=Corallincola luteus TaxID=1775177 RepID=A0ABY2AKN3_9GAMM|nr:maleylacetoacetate isomerase [Corallincola luteus]TCI03401.1 maleylacetoacetate isomerase [Corallincola luteus]
MEYTLYSYWRSSAAYRVRIALALKGLSYRTEPVHLVKHGGEQHSQQYTALNASGLVPTLGTPDGVLRQSLAIMEYLEERHPAPALLPCQPLKRAQSRALALDICCETHPLNNLRVQQYLTKNLGINDTEKHRWMTHWMHKGFVPIEQQLAETGGVFAVGDTPTFADICLIPQVYNAKRFNIGMERFPRITEIWSRCNELEAFIQAAPEAQSDAEPLLLKAQ